MLHMSQTVHDVLSFRTAQSAAATMDKREPEASQRQALEPQAKERPFGPDSVTGRLRVGSDCGGQFQQSIDFFDAAELYPVPPTAERFGVTECV